MVDKRITYWVQPGHRGWVVWRSDAETGDRRPVASHSTEGAAYLHAAALRRSGPLHAGAIVGMGTRHPRTTGPDYIDADGAAEVVICPDCGQMEWWTQQERDDHGQCRSLPEGTPCPACS